VAAATPRQLLDAQGFLHAARIREGGRFSIGALARSASGFAVGIGLYYFGQQYQEALGIRAPEIQTVSWFAVTLIGVAFFSGRFASWRLLDQAIAVLVLMGIAWLMVRTA